MASLNKVFLIGRLTQDPELRYTPSGAAVTDLRMAVNRLYSTRDGERREETLFIDVTVWSRQAETCCQYLRKGGQVHIEGYLKMDSWDDRNTGEKRTKIKVEADRVQFLDGRRDEASGPPPGDEEHGGSPTRFQRPAPEPRMAGNGPSPRTYGSPAPGGPSPRRPASPAPEPDEPDDDIPF